MVSLVSACIYPFEAEVSKDVDNHLVIDGDIAVGEESIVNVSRLSPLSGMLPPDLRFPAVSVYVESGSGPTIVGRCISSGRYAVDTRGLDPDGTYRLRIDDIANGKRYFSPWQKPLKSPAITSMFHSLTSDRVDMCASIQAAEDSKYFKVFYQETWEYSADFKPDWMFDVNADTGDDNEDPTKIYRRPYSSENYYYCWSSASQADYALATVEGLSTDRIEKLVYRTVARTSPRVQIMYSALLDICPLTEDAYVYLDNIQKASNMSGSLFSPTPSDVRGNIRCENDTTEFVIGYVSVYQRVSKRFFLNCEEEKIFIRTENPDDFLFFPVADDDGRYNFMQHYYSGKRPVYTKIRDDAPSKTNMYWAPARCTDCREAGGTKIKPSYWPNNHE